MIQECFERRGTANIWFMNCISEIFELVRELLYIPQKREKKPVIVLHLLYVVFVLTTHTLSFNHMCQIVLFILVLLRFPVMLS